MVRDLSVSFFFESGLPRLRSIGSLRRFSSFPLTPPGGVAIYLFEPYFLFFNLTIFRPPGFSKFFFSLG